MPADRNSGALSQQASWRMCAGLPDACGSCVWAGFGRGRESSSSSRSATPPAISWSAPPPTSLHARTAARRPAKQPPRLPPRRSWPAQPHIPNDSRTHPRPTPRSHVPQQLYCPPRSAHHVSSFESKTTAPQCRVATTPTRAPRLTRLCRATRVSRIRVASRGPYPG